MKKILKYIIIIVLVIIGILGFRSCIENISYDKGRTANFTSPNGEITLTLEYDYVSRPFLFYNNDLIFSYTGTGFSETVFFEIEWLSENEIRLFCKQYNEEFFIILK